MAYIHAPMNYRILSIFVLFFSIQSSLAQVESDTVDADTVEERMNKVYVGFFSGYNGLAKAPTLSWHANYQRQLIDQLSLGLSLGYVQSTTSSDDIDLSEYDTTIIDRKISQGYFKMALLVAYTQNFKKPAHQISIGLGPAMAFNSKAQVIREENEDDFYLEDVLSHEQKRGQIKPGIGGMIGYTYTGKRHFVCGLHVMYDVFFGKNNPTFFNVLPGVSLGGSF